MSFLSVTDLNAGYGNKIVNKNISFELNEGEICGVLGINGCGKTTMLKAICNIIPHTGKCEVDGIDLEELSIKQMAQLCSYIPQQSGISIDMKVIDVVLMGFNPHLGLLQYPSRDMTDKAKEMLIKVGLEGKADMNYLHLSEGQKQLCILARTMVTDSKLLFMDEPESALDFRMRYKIFSFIKEWMKEKNKAAILTLHDINLALNYCDKILLMNDGTIVETVLPKVDSIEKIEEKMQIIYGKVSVVRCNTKLGTSQLVMLKEQD